MFIEADLDEFVDLERVIHGPDHCVGRTELADEDDGLKVMRQAPKALALGCGQCGQGAASLVRVLVPLREQGWACARARTEIHSLSCSEVRILQFRRIEFQVAGIALTAATLPAS